MTEPSHRPAAATALAACALATLVIALPGRSASAAPPSTVTIEGALHSTGGGPAADGTYSLQFGIFAKAEGGTAVWSETAAAIKTVNGRFTFALGSTKALDAAALAALPAQWLSIKVGADPELPRQPLRATMFALYADRAASVTCTDCVKSTSVGFNYAASDTKGGPALKSKALDCTGCVTVAQLKFDKPMDLGQQTLTAAKLTSSGDIQAAGLIAAKQFVGDGSKLTNITVGASNCPKGKVASGIDGSGKVVCIVAGGDLDSVSAGLFTQHFSDTFAGTGGDIPDNNSSGLLSSITVPDLGVAESVAITVDISKAPFVDVTPKDGKPDYDPTDLTVLLFAPSTKALPSPRSNIVNNFLSKPSVDQTLFPNYVLHQGTGAGTLALATTYPTKTKPAFGDLAQLIGTNPKGNWRLLVLDNSDRKDASGKDVTIDGKLVSWSITVGYKASKQLQMNGELVFAEAGARVRGARIKQTTATALAHGKSITLDTGTDGGALIAQAWFWNATSKRWIQANAGSAGASDCTACGTAADGTYKPTGSTSISTSKVWNFKDFIIPKGITVTATGTQPLDIRVTGTIDIQGSLLLNGGTGGNVSNSSTGCYGGKSTPGKGAPGGYDGGYGVYTSPIYPGQGPGGGKIGGNGSCGYGGGGGGHGGTGGAGSGSGGAGGSVYNSVNANNLTGGSGGGAGGYGSATNAIGPGGGGGGGAVRLTGAEVVIAGTISANGGAGGRNYNGCDGGDSGGGAGGGIWIRGGTVNLTGAQITALGGAGGNATGSGECGAAGGAGAVGRIRVDSTQAISGNTNPTFIKGDSSGLAPPVQNKFRIDHSANGQVSLTNDSGVPQSVRLCATY